ncbi:MAG TPA: hypothetical protein VMF65_15945 [Acidimicrobiales bacterium]|nr:hypothetical protein [Acidimicrobiales bacterium]
MSVAFGVVGYVPLSGPGPGGLADGAQGDSAVERGEAALVGVGALPGRLRA